MTFILVDLIQLVDVLHFFTRETILLLPVLFPTHKETPVEKRSSLKGKKLLPIMKNMPIQIY